jgi:DNA repair protein RadA/Sms
VCFAAEVGLGGEVRAVNRIESRISEAEKLGFKEIYVSKYSVKGVDLKNFKIKVRTVARLDELFQLVLQG